MKRLFAAALTAALFLFLAPGVRAAEPDNEVLGRSGAWAAETDAMVGVSVRCRSRFLAEGGRRYIVRGRLDPGLRLDKILSLRQNGEDINAAYYTVLTRGLAADCAFEIHFSDRFAPAGEAELEIEYPLTWTEDVDPVAGESCFLLELWDENEGIWAAAPARVRFFGLNLYRGIALGEGGRQSNPLADACFSLYYDAACTRRVAFLAAGDGVYLACAGENCGHSRHEYLLRTRSDGRIMLSGLGAGTFYLSEKRAAGGYAPTAEGLEIAVDESGALICGGMEIGDGELPLLTRIVSEKTGNGERDPLLFYERGCRVLAALLSVLLLNRRRLFA